jgi:hypothetical protein
MKFECFFVEGRIIAMNMKTLLAGFVAFSLTLGAFAADKAPSGKGKPYPLKTCIVSDEPLGGDHGEPYVFVHEGQEIKLCCKPCLKDFNKSPATYLKKLDGGKK